MSLRSDADQEALYEDTACRDYSFRLYWQALVRRGYAQEDPEQRRIVRAHWCEAWAAARRARWTDDMGRVGDKEPPVQLWRPSA
jgi:hypothetical protein